MGGLEDADVHDGVVCDKKTSSFDVSSVSCSICLDSVTDDGDRSRAKLQCGHEFHLDCIGSAFNIKGAMQCPNCRKIERGRWLYASGSTRSIPEFGMDDWTSDEDPYELNYSEVPFRVHWCPFSGVARVHSSYEEMESPSTTYHNLQRHHPIYAEHAAGSSMPHSYFAYFGPIPPTSSNTGENVEDRNFSHWNSISGRNEIITAHAFPVIDIQYHSWSHHSHPFPTNSGHINSIDQASVPPATLRPSRAEFDAMTRFGSFVHPYIYGHGSASRGTSSFFLSVVHPGSNSLSHERVQASQFIPRQHQPRSNPSGLPPPMIPGIRRFNGPRVVPPPEHSSGFFVFPSPGSSGRNLHEPENSNHVHAWERDHSSHLPHISPAASVSDAGNRSSGFWHRHWS
ncbi:hypothetical protein NMG60_11035008 [Bertholletia excelsa]